MPGSSIWLLPPRSSPLESALSRLISELPTHFTRTSALFIPHLTLTSSIPSSLSPSDFLAKLPSISPPEITFKALVPGETYLTKLALHVEKTEELKELAGKLRAVFGEEVGGEEEIARWREEVFVPHVSLVYSETGKGEVEGMLGVLSGEVEKEGVVVGKRGKMGGWRGGRIVLVNTWKEIGDWKVLAEREL